MRVSVVATGIDAPLKKAAPEAVRLEVPETAPATMFRFQAQPHKPQPAPLPQRAAAVEPSFAATLRAAAVDRPETNALPSFVPQPVGVALPERRGAEERAPNLFERMKGLAFTRPQALPEREEPEPAKVRTLHTAHDRDADDDVPAFLKRERLNA
jgi:hypothetical protein